jgi:hypothetical protein
MDKRLIKCGFSEGFQSGYALLAAFGKTKVESSYLYQSNMSKNIKHLTCQMAQI